MADISEAANMLAADDSALNDSDDLVPVVVPGKTGADKGAAHTIEEFRRRMNILAWCMFDGTASSLSIIDGWNVSGVTDEGTGNYLITFQDALPANYIVLASASKQASQTFLRLAALAAPDDAGTTTCRVRVEQSGAAFVDSPLVAMVCVGSEI